MVADSQPNFTAGMATFPAFELKQQKPVRNPTREWAATASPA
jgi:hypothetical protein